MEFREASEIENICDAVKRVKPRYYDRRYLRSEIYFPRFKKNKPLALLDYSEIGRLLNREESIIGGRVYECSNVDINILEGGIYGDFELCVLDGYDHPFQTQIKNPKKKDVLKKFSTIANKYMYVLSPCNKPGILEVGDYEDQFQIDAARKANCDCIITSDYHLLQLKKRGPVGITPEAFAKLSGISLGEWDNLLKFTDTTLQEEPAANTRTMADFMDADIRKIAGY